MEEYLYGVREFLYKVDGVEETKIIKETPRQFQVKDGIDAYGHNLRIPKDHPMIAFNVNEAMDKYVKKQYETIDDLQAHISKILRAIESAKEFYE